MKNMILTGVLLVTLLTLAHCTKSEEEIIIPNNGSNVELQANLTESRTIADGLSTTWAANDAMKVWIGEEDSYTNCGEFTLSENNLSTGIFTGTLPANYDATKSYDWYALYPYSTANYDASGTPQQATMMIGTNIQRQTGGYNSIAHIAESVAPLYGVTRSAAAGVRPAIQMKHLSTLVKVVVKNLDEEPLEVAKIAIEAEHNAITGRAAINFTGDEPTFDPVAAASHYALLRVTANEETIAPNEQATFYVALIPFTAPAEGEKLSVSVVATNGDICTRTFTLPAGTAFKAGEINTLNLKYAATQAVDLSAEGTANCYIVTTEGDYKFKTTKGNSDETPEMVTADWLWMSETDDLISDVRFVDGYVYFKAGAKKGNAVVAGFTSKEVISWSWHIWLTDDPRTNLHYGMSTDWQVLDRNLGATSTAVDDYKSYGLYYQWGRKDPFVGANTAGTQAKKEEAEAFTTATATYVINPTLKIDFSQIRNSRVPSGGELAWSIANPMAFSYYHADSDVNGAGQNWWNSTYADFIGLWGFVGEDQAVDKTIYDPCPAGYHVPPYAGSVYEGIAASNIAVPSGSTTHGFNFTGAGGSSYYPAAGSRQGYLSYMGLQAIYWSAMDNTGGLNFRGLLIEGGGTKINTNVKVAGYYGLPVRCVKSTK